MSVASFGPPAQPDEPHGLFATLDEELKAKAVLATGDCTDVVRFCSTSKTVCNAAFWQAARETQFGKNPSSLIPDHLHNHEAEFKRDCKRATTIKKLLAAAEDLGKRMLYRTEAYNFLALEMVVRAYFPKYAERTAGIKI